MHSMPSKPQKCFPIFPILWVYILMYLRNRLANLRLTRLSRYSQERGGSRVSCEQEAILRPALISTWEPHFPTNRMPMIFLPTQVFCYFGKINETRGIFRFVKTPSCGSGVSCGSCFFYIPKKNIEGFM